MRDTLGWLALGAGLAGLCLWSLFDHAPEIEAKVTSNTLSNIGDTIHPVTAQVKGRDIIISGLANSDEERQQILDRAEAVDGRRVIVDQLEVLDQVSPYKFGATKKDGVLSYMGHKPTASSFENVLGTSVSALTLAAGAPDENWVTVVETSLGALGVLDEGSLEISDQAINFTGMAADEATAKSASKIFDELPDGYVADVDVGWITPTTGLQAESAASDEVLASASEEVGIAASPSEADGLTLSYSASAGAEISGSLPAGLDMAAMAAALNLDELNGAPKPSEKENGEAILNQLKTTGGWLPILERLRASFSESGVKFDGVLQPGSNLEIARRALEAELGEGAAVNLAKSERIPADGEERTNPITGIAEKFQSGFWLPVFDFAVDLSSCQSQVDGAIGAAKINFLSGSSDLDPRSIHAVNTVSAILRKCLAGDDLALEIGGHTDSQGEDEANMALSVRRAEAVKNAMIVRGIPDNKMQSKGYGEGQPIASNDTEEGRASNRRTSFTWSQK